MSSSQITNNFEDNHERILPQLLIEEPNDTLNPDISIIIPSRRPKSGNVTRSGGNNDPLALYF